MKNNVSVKFDRSNKNTILFKDNGRLMHMLAIPHSRDRCDAINLSETNMDPYDFNGIVVVQGRGVKTIFNKGKILDHITY